MVNQVNEAVQFIKSYFLNSDPDLAISIHCPKCKRKVNCKVSEIDTEGAFLENHLAHHCYLSPETGGRIDIPTEFEEEVSSPVPTSQSVNPPESEDVPLVNPESNLSEDFQPDPQVKLPKIITPTMKDVPIDESDSPGASPQAENGHIDIANELGEALAKINISPYESRILWALWRKTYGWHKKTDRISITQFQGITGIKRRHVHRTLSNLIKRNIVTSKGNTKILTYGFQKDYTKWKNVTSTGNNQLQKISSPIGKKATSLPPEVMTDDRYLLRDGSLPLQVPTKETIQKKKGGQPKKTDPWVKEFLDWWCEILPQKKGVPYHCIHGKDEAIAKKLLLTFDLQDLKQYALDFLKDEEGERKGFTIGVFSQAVNRIAQRRASDPIEQIKRQERLRKEGKKRNESN